MSSNVIQSGLAPVLTDSARAYTVKYDLTTTLLISCETHDAYMAFSEGNLQSPYARFTVRKAQDAAGEGPTQLVLPFSQPTSGTLFFRSANAGDTCRVTVVQLGGQNG